MKKKIVVGLLTVAACLTIGSTSFATSAITSASENSSSESAKVVSSSWKYVYEQEILPKSVFPTLESIPAHYGYNKDGYVGTLSLVLPIDGETAVTWTVTYFGPVTKN